MVDRIYIEDFQPRSELVVPQHLVPRAKFPVVDAHNHITHHGFSWEKGDMAHIVDELDFLNVAAVVNLSGETGDVLKRNLEKLDQAFPGRFLTYCNIDFKGLGTPG